MRIPTILCLLLLAITLGFGIFNYQYNKQVATVQKNQLQPKDIRTVNISDTSFSITWLTSQPVESHIIVSEADTIEESILKPKKTQFILPDSRDGNNPTKRLTHLATASALKPNTKYYFKIKSSGFLYPSESQFITTATELPADQSLSPDEYPPFVGTTLNPDSSPNTQSLIFLDINGASPYAAYSSQSGGFIFPLTNLYTSSLDKRFVPQNPTQAIITVTDGNKTSTIKLNLPINGKNIPPFRIDQNLDLTSITTSDKVQTNSRDNTRLDLNNDRKINSIDLSIVLQSFGKNPRSIKNSDFKSPDINNDRKVDQEDINLIISTLKK